MKILYNANIHAPMHGDATALVIDRDRFKAFGSNNDLLKWAPKSAHFYDLQGRTIWPGLTDSHLHLNHLADSLAIIDCETQTLESCLNRIKEAAVALPKNAWIHGHGWNQNEWQAGVLWSRRRFQRRHSVLASFSSVQRISQRNRNLHPSFHPLSARMRAERHGRCQMLVSCAVASLCVFSCIWSLTSLCLRLAGASVGTANATCLTDSHLFSRYRLATTTHALLTLTAMRTAGNRTVRVGT